MYLTPSLLNQFAVNLQTPQRGPYVPRVREGIEGGGPLQDKQASLAYDAAAFRRLVVGLQAEGESRRLKPDLPEHFLLSHVFPMRPTHQDISGRPYPTLGCDHEAGRERTWQLVAAYPELRGYASLGFSQVHHDKSDGSAVQIRHRGASDPIHVWASYGRGGNEIMHQGELDADGRPIFNSLGIRIQHGVLDPVPHLLFAIWSLWQMIDPGSPQYNYLFQDGLVIRTSGHPEAKPWIVPHDDVLDFLESGKISNDIQFQIESSRTLTLDDTYSRRVRPVFSLRQQALQPTAAELTQQQEDNAIFEQKGVLLGLAAFAARKAEEKDWVQQQRKAHSQSQTQPPPLKRLQLVHYYQTPDSDFPVGLLDLAERVKRKMEQTEFLRRLN